MPRVAKVEILQWRRQEVRSDDHLFEVKRGKFRYGGYGYLTRMELAVEAT